MLSGPVGGLYLLLHSIQARLICKPRGDVPKHVYSLKRTIKMTAFVQGLFFRPRPMRFPPHWLWNLDFTLA